MERITNIQIQEFLKDFEENSITKILEEGKETQDIIAIAKAKEINLKNNKDLSGFKTIYAFANIPNKNNARLPKKILLKALPSMIGKPVDIDHQRHYVIGHYIDYRYIAKEDMVVAYGVFYKSNFGEEWEEARNLFKKGKLATSFEIWCPPEKRRNLSDGTYELLQIEIAGGAILFKEEPAFEDALVLELAKKNSETMEEDLVFANKYKENELIMCKDNVCKTVSCPMAKNKTEILNIKSEITTIKCSNCQEDFKGIGLNESKCPKCFAILDKNGSMIYPPQMKDFNIRCEGCKVNSWLIISRNDKEAKLRCLHCAKEYNITFAKKKENKFMKQMNFIYISNTICLQCGRGNDVVGTSAIKIKSVKCKRCGLEYLYDISRTSYKQIAKIEEIKKDTSEKGGKEKMAKDKKIEKASEKVEEAKVEEKVEEAKVEDKVEEKVEDKVEEKVEDKVEEKVEVIEKVEAKVEEEKVEEKVEEEKVEDKVEEKVEVIEKVEEVIEKLDGEQNITLDADNKVEEHSEAEAEIVPEAEEKVEVEEPKVEEIEEKQPEEAKDTKEQKYAKGIRKLASTIKEMRKTLKMAKQESIEEIAFYKANAEEINSRRKELKDYAKDLTDRQILEDKAYTKAKIDMKNASIVKATIVGDKVNGSDYYSDLAKKINKIAYK